MMSNLSLDSPARRRGPIPSNLNSLTPLSAREDVVMQSPMTPNKKRRFDYGPPPLINGRRPDGPYYPQYASRRESLPPIQVRYSPPNSATMAPPRTPREARRGSLHDLGPSAQDETPRSVEEVLNAFPYLNKIKLLGRITPPYKQPDVSTPQLEQTRGAILAVEGDDIDSVKEITKWLNDYLIGQEEFKPRITEPPRRPEDDHKDVTFEDYLDLIREWHGRSREMIEYITTLSTSAPPSQDGDASDKESAMTDISERRDSASPPDTPRAVSSLTPVIILPTFQLQASAAFASRIAIQDAYSATDHWQWMATLWRGIVGPDLTVYIKTYEAKDGFAGSKPDLDEAVRCLTIFKEKDAKFSHADLRRAGFEVNEFIKGMKV